MSRFLSMSLPSTLSRHAPNVASTGRRFFCSQTHHLCSHSLPETRAERGRDLKNNLQKLFRNVAQPVAVVTSFMPDDRENTQRCPLTNKFHGATLSSFSSIALDPYPLVSFALRIPSRMATTLSSLSTTPSAPAHMVVNLLSAHQSSTAIMFSRPDLYPSPFESSEVQYRLSEEGLPVLEGVVGALSCIVVTKGIPLHDLDYLAARNGFDSSFPLKEVVLQRGGVASELFIARVIRVDSIGERMSPLVYHRRDYTTCLPKS